MATSLIHFGADDCSRVLVLQDAGYRVHQCDFIPELKSALRESSRPAAALFGEFSEMATMEAVSIVRDLAVPLPIIYFSNKFHADAELSWPDLVVPAFTAPQRWLRWIASIIEQSRGVRANSIELRKRSALLRREAFTASRRSVLERMRCAQTIADMEDFTNDVEFQPCRSKLPN